MKTVLMIVILALSSYSSWAGCNPCICGPDGSFSGDRAEWWERNCPNSQPRRTRNTLIKCAGDNGPKVQLESSLKYMKSGTIPAKFTNIESPKSDFVTVTDQPIFHMLQVSVVTAFCEYKFILDSTGEGKFYVFGALKECEGNRTKLQCDFI